jgi:dolichol-phosphate mannosyltransferase
MTGTTTTSLTGSSFVTVVIPTFNERDNLPDMLRELIALGPAYRMVVVDDNSPDGTGEVADRIAAAHPGRIAVLHRPAKAGIGPAYIAGFEAALAGGAQRIASMDADHSHAPLDLPRLVDATSSHDLAIGSRYVAHGRTVGWPWYRRLLSRGGGLYARYLLGLAVSDPTSGFKVYRRDLLANLDLPTVRATGYGFTLELTHRAVHRGARTVEIPITFTERSRGRSKLSGRIISEALWLVWRLRLERRRSPTGRLTRVMTWRRR